MNKKIKSVNELKGFKVLSKEKQINMIASGSGLGVILKAISSFCLNSKGFLSAITSPVQSIFYQIERFKILDKIKDAQKGEIEFGKDGCLKFKWDSSIQNPVSSPSTFIF